MKNLGRNTAAVLVVTLFTGLAVFSAIQLGGRLFGTSSANAQTIAAPAVVQSSEEASDEYGDDEDSNAYGQSSDGYDQGSQGYADPYGQSGSSSADSGGTTMTCPATGCSASSCHAMQ